MALIDDIEFYGRAVDAQEMHPDEAARLLVKASRGRLTLRAAAKATANWTTARSRYERIRFDVVDTLRGAQNGRPVPEHVRRRSLHAAAWRDIRDTSTET